MRVRPRFWVLVAALAATSGLTVWALSRPEPQLLEAPELTPALRVAILQALSPGWPAQKPTLSGPDGPVAVVAGRVDAVAAADVDGDGAPEWGVAYTWLGAPDPSGARAHHVGFSVLAGGDVPESLYEGPGAGGWNGPQEGYFTNASATSARVEAVHLGEGGIGFLQHVTAEMAVGGRLSQSLARLHAPRLGEWHMAWTGETEHRWRAGTAEETARSVDIRVEDVDGDGRLAITTEPSWYVRRLGKDGRGVHFSAAGLGKLVHRPSSGAYELTGLLSGAQAERQLRSAAPILATRAPGPMAIDARFDDWDRAELVAITGMRFEDAGLLKYKRRDRHGIEDFSGDMKLMWDLEALYVKASVVDDVLKPGPAGRELYQGDHLALWLDWDLAGDFRQDARSADDWQIGLRPGAPGRPPEAYCWVPKAGAQGVKIASRPLIDPYSGGSYGYELEAAIPWSTLGGLPPGMAPGPLPAAPAAGDGQARRYALTVAGAMGFGAVLTDADKQPQELIYVSNPGFTWAAPRSFNTLLLVDQRPEK